MAWRACARDASTRDVPAHALHAARVRRPCCMLPVHDPRTDPCARPLPIYGRQESSVEDLDDFIVPEQQGSLESIPDDMQINPIMLMELKAEKEKALREQRAKAQAQGLTAGTGGLRRLGFRGKSQTAKDQKKVRVWRTPAHSPGPSTTDGWPFPSLLVLAWVRQGGARASLCARSDPLTISLLRVC